LDGAIAEYPCLSAVRSSSELNGGGGEGSLLQDQVVAAKMQTQTSVFSTRGQRAQTTVD
jgi:hypothetical protein